MKRLFIYGASVTSVLRKSRVTDGHMMEMEKAIMLGDGVTVAGTGGLERIRCGLAGSGKSGAVRVLFADYPTAGRVYLLVAFAKNEKDNVSRGERNDLRKLKEILDKFVKGLKHDEEKK